MSDVKKTGGLAGIVAGETAISTVGKEGVGLTYRGYSIEDLSEHATFEEVAWLMLYGALPKKSELESYRHSLMMPLRGLPAPLEDHSGTIARRDASDGCVAHRLLGPRLPGT